MANPLLDVRHLRTHFDLHNGTLKAVDDVSFRVNPGETIGIVGESGCGKSMTSLSVMQLVPRPRGSIVGGSIEYFGAGGPIDIAALSPRSPEMRQLRGRHISLVFQEPMTSFHPCYTIGDQIVEALKVHEDLSKAEAHDRAIELLRMVNMSAADKRVDAYPHELSGGMRQRAMIAMALSCSPKLLIADEPTTALDVTIEAQIIELLQELQSRLDMSIMFISHDLDVIGEMSRRVLVMYVGKIVERSPVREIFHNPLHPYTKALVRSIPQIGRKKRLEPITGSVPPPTNLPAGCHFAPRCPYVMDVCRREEPPMFAATPDHAAKCWLYREHGLAETQTENVDENVDIPDESAFPEGSTATKEGEIDG